MSKWHGTQEQINKLGWHMDRLEEAAINLQIMPRSNPAYPAAVREVESRRGGMIEFVDQAIRETREHREQDAIDEAEFARQTAKTMGMILQEG